MEKQTLAITAFETPVENARRLGLTRRNAFGDLDYLLQQRVGNTVNGTPDGTVTEWATVAAFNFTVHADTFVAVFRAKYPQSHVEWRLLSLKA